mgnify:CR=1 FL=1|jgi:hypothetical protein
MEKETRKPRRNTAINVDFEYRYIWVKVISVEKDPKHGYKIGYQISEKSYYYGKEGVNMGVWYVYGNLAPKVGTIERLPMIIDID